MANLTKEQTKQIIIETLKPYGVLRIGIFGSYAKNEARSDSDIDILVKLPTKKNRPIIGLSWFTLDAELEEKLGRSVDLVSEAALLPLLKKQIEKDLEIIYEKAG